MHRHCTKYDTARNTDVTLVEAGLIDPVKVGDRGKRRELLTAALKELP